MRNFYCVNCGEKSNTIPALTSVLCRGHENGPLKGNHVIYEGTEKPKYMCKYCGREEHTMKSLVWGTCTKHPKGPAKGRHVPSL